MCSFGYYLRVFFVIHIYSLVPSVTNCQVLTLPHLPPVSLGFTGLSSGPVDSTWVSLEILFLSLSSQLTSILTAAWDLSSLK